MKVDNPEAESSIKTRITPQSDRKSFVFGAPTGLIKNISLPMKRYTREDWLNAEKNLRWHQDASGTLIKR